MDLTTNLILPGDPDFFVPPEILPGDFFQLRDRSNGEALLIARNGMLEAATLQEAEDYLWGGEYEHEQELQGDHNLIDMHLGDQEVVSFFDFYE